MSDKFLVVDNDREPFILVKRKTLRKKASGTHKGKKDLNIDTLKKKVMPDIEKNQEE